MKCEVDLFHTPLHAGACPYIVTLITFSVGPPLSSMKHTLAVTFKIQYANYHLFHLSEMQICETLITLQTRHVVLRKTQVNNQF